MTPKLNDLILSNPALWVRAGDRETALLHKKLDAVCIDRPVYVCGLARSGTTITLEALAAHPDAGSHSYSDFPFVFTPYFWNRFQPKALGGKMRERAHQDGLLVNAQSPESMEEILWDYFFEGLHNPLQDNRLTAATSNPAFEKFYAEHIRKLLLAKGKSRYVSKANYNLSRIRYLAQLFPDACFVVLVRRPLDFVESCLKQDRLFTAEQQAKPDTLRHTERSKHFEFGLGKKPVNFGDDAAMQRILDYWQSDATAHLGWAEYWNTAYAHVQELLADATLQSRLLLLPYEQLCSEPAEKLSTLYDFCALPNPQDLVAEYAAKLHLPSYYKHRLNAGQQAEVTAHCAAVSHAFYAA